MMIFFQLIHAIGLVLHVDGGEGGMLMQALQFIPFVAAMLFSDDMTLGEEAAPVTQGSPPGGPDPAETIPLLPNLAQGA